MPSSWKSFTFSIPARSCDGTSCETLFLKAITPHFCLAERRNAVQSFWVLSCLARLNTTLLHRGSPQEAIFHLLSEYLEKLKGFSSETSSANQSWQIWSAYLYRFDWATSALIHLIRHLVNFVLSILPLVEWQIWRSQEVAVPGL
jgi:hypothetical protein